MDSRIGHKPAQKAINTSHQITSHRIAKLMNVGVHTYNSLNNY